MTHHPHIETLNRRLGESLGRVCGGSLPRFSWLWAPNQPWFMFDLDDRTLVKKSWASAPAPDGGIIGRAWVMGEWRRDTSYDHHGYGAACEDCKGTGRSAWSGAVNFSTGRQMSRGGMRTCPKCAGAGRTYGIRIPVAHEWHYAPYFETAIGHGHMPTEELNANYISVLAYQIDMSAAQTDKSMDMHLAEEKYVMDAQKNRFANEHLERSAAEYDKYTGAFNNLEPGKVDGFMSIGGLGDSPILKRFQDAAVA